MAPRKKITRKATAGKVKVKLRPHDPFDLIRLLARSQSDPRKAVAELVQNSLDAGAKRVEIQWFNEKGARALSIWDDGAGVFPHEEREDALRRIAQTIGHSHKRDLTPAQRREELILGKYGIGLIGFWSVGKTLEMRSRVDGGKGHVLRLQEDREQAEVFPSRSRRLDEAETYTEVTIRTVHPSVINKIKPPRLHAFLATELRGQLLDRDAVVRISDRVARGRARKQFIVKPQPYLGRPIEDLTVLEVPGFESARVELYMVATDEERHGLVSLCCGGTVVLDDIAEIDGVQEPRAPWTSGRFEGVIDFPDMHVAPASRRGFSHDEPVAAFIQSLAELESELATRLDSESERRAALRNQQVARQIRRAFVGVAEALPDYDFFEVRAEAQAPAEEEAGPSNEPEGEKVGDAVPPAVDGTPEANPPSPMGDGPGDSESPSGPPSVSPSGAGAGGADSTPPAEPSSPPKAGASAAPAVPDEHLFPPGPPVIVKLKPRRARLEPGQEKAFHAVALDEDGRPTASPVEWSWTLEGPGVLTPGEGGHGTYEAPARLHTEERSRIAVRALHGDGESTPEATATVTITVPTVETRTLGIPEPLPVAAPGESWRSRIVDGAWEFNESHPDFLAVADGESKRVRYLIHLFAKEVVLRNFGGPGDALVLERMVEVLTRLGR